MEAQRQAGENEGDFEAVGLSRGDVGRDVRHRNQQLLADVRAENPRIRPHPVSYPYRYQALRSQPGLQADELEQAILEGRTGNSGDVPGRAGSGSRQGHRSSR